MLSDQHVPPTRFINPIPHMKTYYVTEDAGILRILTSNEAWQAYQAEHREARAQRFDSMAEASAYCKRSLAARHDGSKERPPVPVETPQATHPAVSGNPQYGELIVPSGRRFRVRLDHDLKRFLVDGSYFID